PVGGRPGPGPGSGPGQGSRQQSRTADPQPGAGACRLPRHHCPRRPPERTPGFSYPERALVLPARRHPGNSAGHYRQGARAEMNTAMTDDMNNDIAIGVLLADQVERLLEREVTRERLIAVEQDNFDNALWQALETLGITLALAPEAAGGAGLRWEDAEPALRAAGGRAAPVPLGETLLATWALGHAGLEIPPGPIAVAQALFQLDGDRRLSGGDAVVPWIAHCQHLVVVAESAGEHFICLLERNDLEFDGVETLARIPSSRVAAEAVRPAATAAAPGLGELGLLPAIAAVRTVQMAGILDRLLALCVEYGNTREQFGR